MTISSPYIENLALFLSILRSKGLLIPTAEAGEAANLLIALGVSDRETVKATLRAMLATTPRELRIFDMEFNNFFVSEEVEKDRQQKEIQEQSELEEQINKAKEELRANNLPEELAETFAKIPESRQEWMKTVLKRIIESPRHLPLAESFLNRVATGWLSNSFGAVGLEALEDDPEEDLLYKKLATITEEEAPRALALIELLVRRINGAAERKYRRAGKDGIPDIRATIHRSLRTGGVPINPQYKKRPRGIRRFVILCDVSESMYKTSGFALRLITALGGTKNRTEAYIFSEGLEQISLNDLQVFEETVKASSLWRKGTDIGRALNELMALTPPVVGSGTLLIIISDAKSVNIPTALEALKDIKALAKGVLWLNPDGAYTSGPAEEFALHCNMLPCSTLGELSAACQRAIQL